MLGLLDDAFELEFSEGECPLRGESGEAIWQLFTSSHGTFKALVESLAHDRREEFHLAFVDYLERYRADGVIRAPDDYLLVLGKHR